MYIDDEEDFDYVKENDYDDDYDYDTQIDSTVWPDGEWEVPGSEDYL